MKATYKNNQGLRLIRWSETLTPARLTRLKSLAPTLACLALVVLMSLSLTWQALQLLRDLRSPVSAPTLLESRQGSSSAGQVPVHELFGAAPVANIPTPETNLQLTLEASFVHPDSRRSAAIIRDQNNKAQRYVIDQEIASGVTLLEVHADHVVLGRGLARESLYYPTKRPSGISSYQSASVYEQADVTPDLEQLQDENYQLLRERMESLRQEMSAAGITETSTETESSP